MEKPFVQTSGDVISSTQFTTTQDPSELPMFDFNRILVTTDYFSTGNKLGQGGFGPVYKVVFCFKIKLTHFEELKDANVKGLTNMEVICRVNYKMGLK